MVFRELLYQMGEKIMGEIQQKAYPQMIRLTVLQLFEPQFPPVNFITYTLRVFNERLAMRSKLYGTFAADKKFTFKFFLQADYLTA
jgi:hypothetical protein